MEKPVGKICLLFFMALGLSCQTAQVVRVDPEQQQIPSLQQLRSLYDQAQYQQLIDDSQKFQKDFPYSIFDSQVDILRAQGFIGLENYSSAESLLRGVIEKEISIHPALAAEAMFQLSYCYEALGDKIRWRAIMRDLLKYREFLSLERKIAEYPARMASLSLLMGQLQESEVWLKEAERGVFQMRSQVTQVNKDWFARIYFQMGQIYWNSYDPARIEKLIDGLKIGQIFLIKSMEYNSSVWSEKSLEKLQSIYRDAWNWTMEMNLNDPSTDMAIAVRKKNQVQRKHLFEILNLVDRYQETRLESEKNPVTDRADLFIRQLEKQTQMEMVAKMDMTDVTPETRRRQSMIYEDLQMVDPGRKEDSSSKEKQNSGSPEGDPNL